MVIVKDNGRVAVLYNAIAARKGERTIDYLACWLASYGIARENVEGAVLAALPTGDFDGDDVWRSIVSIERILGIRFDS